MFILIVTLLHLQINCKFVKYFCCCFHLKYKTIQLQNISTNIFIFRGWATHQMSINRFRLTRYSVQISTSHLKFTFDAISSHTLVILWVTLVRFLCVRTVDSQMHLWIAGVVKVGNCCCIFHSCECFAQLFSGNLQHLRGGGGGSRSDVGLFYSQAEQESHFGNKESRCVWFIKKGK